MDFETEYTEFKSQFTDELYKEVIAFANTDGGVIYVGIDDDGNAVRLKPAGVYTRQGASSAPASVEQIRKMIKDNDGDIYENMRSLNQALTFETAAAAFQKYSVDFDEKKYTALGVTDPGSWTYTNLGLVLSDQCEHTTKIAVFGDETNTTFKDSKEFSGSVFRQLDNAFDYLALCNRTVSTFHGLERIEKKDYPEDALREALLNALVHRDYSFSGSIIINVNDQQIEFISIGGLLPGLSPEDIRSGISQPRNKRLAEVFHRLHLIESYGTGIRKIYTLYAKCARQPRIEVTPNTFRMILPNMNASAGTGDNTHPHSQITPQMAKILEFLNRSKTITDAQVQKLLQIKRTRSYTLLKQMCALNLVVSVGRGAEKYYTLPR